MHCETLNLYRQCVLKFRFIRKYRTFYRQIAIHATQKFQREKVHQCLIISDRFLCIIYIGIS